MNYTSPFYKFYHLVASIPSKVHFKRKKFMSQKDREHLANILAKGYYIILTGNNYALSSKLIRFITLLKTGKWKRYSHVLMNVDNIENPEDVRKFKFMEATAVGVHYSSFNEVFDCDYVCVLTPKNIDNQEWTRIIDKAVEQNHKPYDDLFQLSDSTHISCVELVRNALMANNSYEEEFQNLEKMILKEGNLLPQMFRDCPDFEVVYEIS